MKKKLTFCLLFVFLNSVFALASIIKYKKLEDVLSVDQVVFSARVQDLRSEPGYYYSKYHYRLTDFRLIYGEADLPDKMFCEVANPHERHLDGKVLKVSPLRIGSGLEARLRVGEKYIFISEDLPKVLRVESLEAEQRILDSMRANEKSPGCESCSES